MYRYEIWIKVLKNSKEIFYIFDRKSVLLFAKICIFSLFFLSQNTIQLHLMFYV